MQRVAANIAQAVGQADVHLRVLGQITNRRVGQRAEQIAEYRVTRHDAAAGDIAAGFARTLEYRETAVQRRQGIEAEAARIHAVGKIERDRLV